MIDAKRLLDDLKRLLRRLEGDLRERADTVAEMHVALEREYQAARGAGRTGEAFEVWREGMLTQAAAAWLLSCVFVRFLEDNGLVEEALTLGSRRAAEPRREQQIQYFQQHPLDSDRDYLYAAFRVVAKLPAVATLFDERHNPIWTSGISGDAAKQLIDFWRQWTRTPARSFTTSPTRLEHALPRRPLPGPLGGGAQELRAAADAGLRGGVHPRPHADAGHRRVRPQRGAADRPDLRLGPLPAGGVPAASGAVVSGGAGTRSSGSWCSARLDAVSGVDLNPFAVAIARFRLLVAALRASGIGKLEEAPAFRINVAAGDSLLHGRALRRARPG